MMVIRQPRQARVKQILDRKLSGYDCTEDESATIKMFLADKWYGDGYLGSFANEVSEAFPLESDEVAGRTGLDLADETGVPWHP